MIRNVRKKFMIVTAISVRKSIEQKETNFGTFGNY